MELATPLWGFALTGPLLRLIDSSSSGKGVLTPAVLAAFGWGLPIEVVVLSV